jgi:RNA polymerase sigma-70 factor (ECF subfamily)
MHATEAEIVKGFRQDPEKFAAVHERFFLDIYRYVAGRLDPQMAEDITSETFLRAFGQRDSFDPERGGLRAWLFGIATKLIASHRRKEARRYKMLARVGPDSAIDSHESQVVTSVTAQRMRPELARALATLSPGERDVVFLVAVGELSYGEVAEALGISAGTVGSRLSRARKKLNVVIDQETTHG